MTKEIKRFLFSLLLFATASSTVNAVEDGYSAAFTRLNFHPQALSMGSAYTALAEGAEALFWNPAGISKSSEREIFVSGTQQFETTSIRVDTLFQTRLAPISVGYLYSDFGSVTNTDFGLNDRLGEQSGDNRYLGQSFYVGSAKSISKHITAGASLGYVYEQISEETAGAIGLDLGLLADYDSWRLGLAVKNVNEPDLQWSTASGSSGKMARLIQVGVAKEFLGRFTQSVDLKMRDNREPTLHAGFSAHVMTNLSLRVGVDDGLLTLGTGLHLSSLDAYVSWKKKEFDAFDEAFQLGLKFKKM